MKKIYLIAIVTLASLTLNSQESVSPVNVEAAYVGEFFSNFSGGIKTGQTYLGLIDFGISINTSDLGIWDNGEFFALVENTHGGAPTADYIGDIQVASNIENGDFTYLYELWYRQQFGKLAIKAGVLDLNADCHVSELAGLYLNSSFGIMATAPLNMPVPIFPMPALGALLEFDITDNAHLIAGVWDGDPGDFENNRYNIEWTLNNRDGFLYMLEGHFNYGTGGVLKAGGLYHSGSFHPLDSSQIINDEMYDTTQNFKGNLELHIIAEHTIINKSEGEKGKLDAFLQLGYMPKSKISHMPLYIGAGINYKGLLLKSAEDQLGLGLAYGKINNEISAHQAYKNYEMAVELTYALPILDNITIQPDFQYIINPGANSSLDNAVTAFLRIIIEH